MRLRTMTLIAASLSITLAACDSGTAPVDNPDPGAANVETPANQEALANLAKRSASLSAGQAIPGHYIVVFKNTVVNPPGLARQLASQFGTEPTYTYSYAIKGFAAALPAPAVTALSSNPNVEWIEEDGIVETTTTQSNPPSWGLDRIDQRNLPLDHAYSYDFDGSGVHAYIIDTGLRYTHSDFGGRASFDADFGTDGGGSTNNGDCHGHGTHVAGTIGSTTYGVAKNTRLHGVRVLNCNGSGSYSSVIAGVDWVRNNAIFPAVANMSLGGGKSTSLNAAVTNLVNAGITMAVAAGNSNANACNYSPSSTPEALTVGSTTSSDARSSFSNYGTCVDIFAPGSSITSTYKNSDGSTATMSGTSMASPHVAGAAALVLDEHPSWTPAQVETELESRATSGVVGNPGSGSPNLLLYSLGSGGGGTPTDDPPTPDFTFTTSDLTAYFTDASTDDGTIMSWDWDFGDGNSSTSQNPSHTYASGGTYSVELRVTDDAFQSDAITKSVEVTAPVVETLVHSGDIQISVSFGRKNANGTALVTVHDDAEGLVSGATVVGDWLVNGSPKRTSTSGTSGSDGVASITSGGMKGAKSGSLITFCVTNISGSNLTYDSGSDHPTCADYDGGGGGGGDPPPPSGFTLSTKANKGQKEVKLTWSGSSASSFDVYRDGSVITTVGSTNQYVDSVGTKGTFEYQVCEAGTSTCTNTDSAKI